MICSKHRLELEWCSTQKNNRLRLHIPCSLILVLFHVLTWLLELCFVFKSACCLRLLNTWKGLFDRAMTGGFDLSI